jgi:hypothetical protein
LSFEVVAEDDDDGRNTFLTTANQPPPLPAACFFPMAALPARAITPAGWLQAGKIYYCQSGER